MKKWAILLFQLCAMSSCKKDNNTDNTDVVTGKKQVCNQC